MYIQLSVRLDADGSPSRLKAHVSALGNRPSSSSAAEDVMLSVGGQVFMEVLQLKKLNIFPPDRFSVDFGSTNLTTIVCQHL